jgi:hypothetical protein
MSLSSSVILIDLSLLLFIKKILYKGFYFIATYARHMEFQIKSGAPPLLGGKSVIKNLRKSKIGFNKTMDIFLELSPVSP